jgi:hypothetical protein
MLDAQASRSSVHHDQCTPSAKGEFIGGNSRKRLNP